jgi:hypothetical protein
LTNINYFDKVSPKSCSGLELRVLLLYARRIGINKKIIPITSSLMRFGEICYSGGRIITSNTMYYIDQIIQSRDKIPQSCNCPEFIYQMYCMIRYKFLVPWLRRQSNNSHILLCTNVHYYMVDVNTPLKRRMLPIVHLVTKMWPRIICAILRQIFAEHAPILDSREIIEYIREYYFA